MNDRFWIIVASVAPLVLGLVIPVVLLLARKTHLSARKAVAEGKNLRRQLHVSQKFEVLGATTGGVVHDLNNILMVVAGSMEMALMREDVPENTKRSLEIGVQAANRGTDLLKTLLKLSRGTASHEVTEVELQSLILESQGILTLLLPKNVRLTLVHPPEPIVVTCDRNILFQMVMNLVVNAKDAMGNRKGGEITIFLEHFEGKALLSVEDNGCGIPEEIREQIFEPLFTTKPEGQGTGLGLSIVRDCVRGMGGEIRVKSSVGVGTTFEISLPISTK